MQLNVENHCLNNIAESRGGKGKYLGPSFFLPNPKASLEIGPDVIKFEGCQKEPISPKYLAERLSQGLKHSFFTQWPFIPLV